MRLVVLLLLTACASAPEAVDDTVAPEPTRFAFPVLERALIQIDPIGVDHDDAPGGDSVAARAICADYLGRAFPHCYDGHDGSDFLLEGSFETMDAGSALVIAGAPGVVVETRDGNYDRCHATLSGEIDCDGAEPRANAVIVEHADGLRSLYWHLMKDSVAVAVGDEVARGDRLGFIGSSGISSFPHLHFEVQDADGDVLDPYTDPAGEEPSLWCEQQSDDFLPGPCPTEN